MIRLSHLFFKIVTIQSKIKPGSSSLYQFIFHAITWVCIPFTQQVSCIPIYLFIIGLTYDLQWAPKEGEEEAEAEADHGG